VELQPHALPRVDRASVANAVRRTPSSRGSRLTGSVSRSAESTHVEGPCPFRQMTHPRNFRVSYAVAIPFRFRRCTRNAEQGFRPERMRGDGVSYFFSLARMALMRFLSAGSVLRERALL